MKERNQLIGHCILCIVCLGKVNSVALIMIWRGRFNVLSNAAVRFKDSLLVDRDVCDNFGAKWGNWNMLIGSCVRKM